MWDWLIDILTILLKQFSSIKFNNIWIVVIGKQNICRPHSGLWNFAVGKDYYPACFDPEIIIEQKIL
jgi:hypothetical protein